MSARIPTRRIGQTALSVLPRPQYQTRCLSLKNPFKRPSKPTDEQPPDYSNPILARVLNKERHTAKTDIAPPEIKQGHLSPTTTLFQPGFERISGYKPGMTGPELAAFEAKAAKAEAEIQRMTDMTLSAARLDPDPEGRLAWERDMVIRGVQRRGRVTKDLRLKRTERELRYRSHDLPGSVKKLTKLANQIAGKTVEEALIQLRFSKKKVARDFAAGLQIARNEAIVARGMGLGAAKPQLPEAELVRLEGESDAEFAARKMKTMGRRRREAEIKRIQERVLTRGTFRTEKSGKPVKIELKDGTHKLVHDATEIYVDQAWVGKGGMHKSMECRAKGQSNTLRHRTTSFSVILKEEKTRMRISEEIKKKRDNRKLWTALPDRPVVAQRQYCLW